MRSPRTWVSGEFSKPFVAALHGGYRSFGLPGTKPQTWPGGGITHPVPTERWSLTWVAFSFLLHTNWPWVGDFPRVYTITFSSLCCSVWNFSAFSCWISPTFWSSGESRFETENGFSGWAPAQTVIPETSSVLVLLLCCLIALHATLFWKSFVSRERNVTSSLDCLPLFRLGDSESCPRRHHQRGLKIRGWGQALDEIHERAAEVGRISARVQTTVLQNCKPVFPFDSCGMSKGGGS